MAIKFQAQFFVSNVFFSRQTHREVSKNRAPKPCVSRVKQKDDFGVPPFFGTRMHQFRGDQVVAWWKLVSGSHLDRSEVFQATLVSWAWQLAGGRNAPWIIHDIWYLYNIYPHWNFPLFRGSLMWPHFLDRKYWNNYFPIFSLHFPGKFEKAFPWFCMKMIQKCIWPFSSIF